MSIKPQDIRIVMANENACIVYFLHTISLLVPTLLRGNEVKCDEIDTNKQS